MSTSKLDQILNDLTAELSARKAPSVFRPVKTTEKALKQREAIEGFVYFTTDSKKIYLGSEEDGYVSMGGNSGIYYGIKSIPKDNSGVEPDPNVVFIYPDEFDENMDTIPMEDDLILNTDGCFYRVNAVSENSDNSALFNVLTRRLTVAGGGGGGSGTDSGAPNYSVQAINENNVFASTSSDMYLKFRANYFNTAVDNKIVNVKLRIKGQEEPFYESGEELEFNVEHKINIAEYKHLFSQYRTTVILELQDAWGTKRDTAENSPWKVVIIDLELSANTPELFYSNTDSYTYKYVLSGASSGIKNKRVVFSYYKDNAVTPLFKEEIDIALDSQGGSKNLTLSKLEHGIYTLQVQAFVDVNNSNQTLPSNIVTHRFAKFSNINNPLLLINLPNEGEQHTNIPASYLLVTNNIGKEYILEIKIDQDKPLQLNINSNAVDTYDFYFEKIGNYPIRFYIPELGNEIITNIKINKYTGSIPVIKTDEPELELYLNPKGKSNNAVDKDVWKEYNGKYTAKIFNGSYTSYSGWLKDKQGTNYLQLNSGASLELNDFYPFEIDHTFNDGFSIELDFELSGVLDYSANIIQCISTQQDGAIQCGFSVTGEKAMLYNSRLNGGEKGPLIAASLLENKRTRLTFVVESKNIKFPMCYVYINGVLSGAVIYDTKDSFQQAINQARLKIFSDKASVKIYGIRFYTKALSDSGVLNNYTASLPTLQEREEEYKSNNVFSGSEISFAMVSSEEYNLQVPYMKITGGYTNYKDSKWKRESKEATKVGLPVGKKDYRLIDIEVKYPDNDYFKDYNDYKFVNEFASGNTMATAYEEEPSNGGCIMYAQGTSSMEYPVKNLRIRFRENSDFYTVRPDIQPVEIICMKADYMESSGSHNTGAANLIDALYKGLNIATPGQDHFKDEDGTIVTCIKGHPCLIFYSPDGGQYQYIGKYNLNLDKATPEPFGFNHDDSDFGYLIPGDNYYEILYEKVKKGVKQQFVGQLKASDSGDYVSGQTETEKTVESEKTVNAIHCFEFLDNAVPVCNFKCRPKDDGGYHSYYETWYNTFRNEKEKEDWPGWRFGFESRYPEDRIGYHDADALYPLASWINELYTLREKEEAAGLSPTDIKYFYNYQIADKYADFTEYFILVDNNYQPAYPNAENFNNNTYYTRTLRESRFEMDSLERFKREYECYFDKDFLITYYLITEALLMADSRVKNMMIATWGKENRQYTALDGTIKETNNYIFYPIFYDMDTMLGLDNTGVYKFNYYDEDTISTLFNGDEVLWFFVRDALKDELPKVFNRLEQANLTYSGILPYFNLNQANMANEAFYNGDARYKYIKYSRERYRDYSKDENDPKAWVEAGDAPYLYALQGDRSLMREWFISNRMRFLRGKYNSSDYRANDRIDFRWYYPGNNTGDPGLDKSAQYVPPTNYFNLTSLKTGYAGVLLGANGNVYNQRFNGVETKTITLPEASGANGTEAYILGLSNLTDLGDLSNKYMQKFLMKSDDVRLENLTLGNPHRCYKNPYWKPHGGQSQQIGLTGCTQLKTFNLQNCADYNNVLDFSNSPAIEKILLTGSNVSGLTLPENGNLKELRLPKSITDLRIHSHSNLTDENFSLGDYRYHSDEEDLRIEDYYIDTSVNADNFINKKYYIFNDEKQQYEKATEYNSNTIYYVKGEYQNDFSRIQTLSIIDTPIDTYEILTQTTNLQSYCLLGVNWRINADNNDVRYCARMQTADVEKALKDKTIKYYYYDINTKSYLEYTRDVYPTEGALYEKIEMLTDNMITSIPMLDYLMTKNTTTQNGNPANHLSGTITLYSENGGIGVEEIDVYKKYNSIYPNITIKYESSINVAEAYTLNFYNLETITEETSPYFSVKGTAKNSISELISGEYTAMALSIPIANVDKPDTCYEFSGMWYDNTSGIAYSHNELLNDSSIKLTSNLNLIPTYKRLPKYFSIEFFGDDGNLYIKDELTYNTNLTKGLDSTIRYVLTQDQEKINSKAYFTWVEDEARFVSYTGNDFKNKAIFEEQPRESKLIIDYIYKNNSDIKMDNQRWDLEGWISERDYLEETENPNFYNVNTFMVKDNLRLYAKMKAVDILTPMNINLFEFGTMYPQDSNTSQYGIRIKSKYRTIVQDELTIPLKDKQGTPLKAILNAGFAEMPFITEIYFENNGIEGSYSYIDVRAFTGIVNSEQTSLLEKVVLPESITYIGTYAFAYQFKLTSINLPDGITYIGERAFSSDIVKFMNVKINKLPSSLTYLGPAAFYRNSGLELQDLPVGLQMIQDNTFAYCPKVAISSFGDEYGLGIKSISGGAFFGAGNEAPKIDVVLFNSSVSSIANSPGSMLQCAFGNSYLAKAESIIIKGGQSVIGGYDILHNLGTDDDEFPPTYSFQ